MRFVGSPRPSRCSGMRGASAVYGRVADEPDRCPGRPCGPGIRLAQLRNSEYPRPGSDYGISIYGSHATAPHEGVENHGGKVDGCRLESIEILV